MPLFPASPQIRWDGAMTKLITPDGVVRAILLNGGDFTLGQVSGTPQTDIHARVFRGLAGDFLDSTAGGAHLVAGPGRNARLVAAVGQVASVSGHGDGVKAPGVQTTDATVTTLATITPPDNTTTMVFARVTAHRTDHGASAGYWLFGTFRKAAGVMALVGAISEFKQEDVAAWDATLVASAGNILVQGTGAALTTINWDTYFVTVEGS